MKTSKALLGLAAATLIAGAFACARSASQASARPVAPVKDMTIAQLTELQKAGAATVCDANTEEFREANGVIPGAVLLTSSSKYDFSQLPSDKDRKLVFYCTGRL